MFFRVTRCTLSWTVGLLVVALSLTLFLDSTAPAMATAPQMTTGWQLSAGWWYPVLRVLSIWAWVAGAVTTIVVLAFRLLWLGMARSTASQPGNGSATR